MSQHEPVGQSPTYQATEKALRGECLETVCTYPEKRNEQRQLREEQAAHSDEQERVEQDARRAWMLVSLEEEEQGYQECHRGYVSGIELVQGGADGNQQEVDGCLHGCTHTDDGEGIVQFYQEVADYAVEDETQRRVCPCRDVAVADGLPQRITALHYRKFG